MPINLQKNVLKRFMSEEQYAQLEKNYMSHRKTFGGQAKVISLEKVPTAQEKAILKTYLEETELSLADIASRYDIKFWQVAEIVRKTAFRLLYQNPRILQKLV